MQSSEPSCRRKPGRHRQSLWIVPRLPLFRNGRLDPIKSAVTLVTPGARRAESSSSANYRPEFSSVTVGNSIYKLRRAAQLIARATDFGWLTEIEKDLALVTIPRSKAERLVLTECLVVAA